MKFLGQGFEKLEEKQDTHATKGITKPHSPLVIRKRTSDKRKEENRKWDMLTTRDWLEADKMATDAAVHEM